MNKTINYTLRLAAGTLGIGLLLYLVRQYTDTRLVHSQVWIILVFLFLLTLATSTFVSYGVRQHREKFNLFFFPTIVFRFFASVIFILIMVLIRTEALLFFVLDFFVLYLLYQVFEITSLMTNLRSHLENRGNEDN